MKIHCSDCQALVPAKNINLERCLATCPECHSVFDFSKLVGGEEEKPKSKLAKIRAKGSTPSNIHVHDAGKTLYLSVRWYHWKFYFFVFFCLFWDGFMAAWFFMAFTSGAIMMAVFGIFHAAVGVALTYYTLCGFVNKTIIYVGDDRIQVKHEPLPWPGGKVMELGEIDQIFCEEKVHRNKNGYSYTYEVHVCLRDGNRKPLLTGLNNAEEAFCIEEKIESFLGIKDRAIEGEMAK